MEAKERAVLIHQFKEGYEVVMQALKRIGPAALDRRPPQEGWTPRQVVHHLADSELASAIRLRLLLAQDHPTIIGYDENEFARRLHYERPIDTSLEVFKGGRLSNSSLLELLTEVEWLREGTHTESGRYSVETWLQMYAAHAHDHARQILQVLR